MRVLVVGLDGATFDIIKPWVEKEELPTIGMLMKKGLYSELISTIPPISSPAWPSFMTGKNPGKHGVFDFVGKGKGYRKTIKNAKDIKAETLWKLLSERGKTCIVINVPVTYPPESINGYIVSGMLTPPDTTFTYPSEICEELKKFGYEPAMKIRKTFSSQKILDYLIVVAQKRAEAALYLMSKIRWDFCMLVFQGTDVIQHNLWQYNQREILQYYKKVDTLIQRLIDRAGEETDIFLMSDHGFGPVYRFFHVNKFLNNLDLLHFQSEPSSGEYLELDNYRFSKGLARQILLKLGITKEVIYELGKRFRMLRFLQKVYRIANVEIPTTKQEILWRHTKAFFSSTIGGAASVQINLRNREPEGIIEEAEYGKIRKHIISQLLRVEDPENGRKIVQYAFRKEEIYHGPYLSEAPDIIFLTDNCEYAATDRIYGDSLVSEPIHKGRGTHRMNGILIACGPDIKRLGKKVKKAKITDLTPTFLHMFGSGIPEDMDGKVLTHIFNSNSDIAKRVIKDRKIDEKTRIKRKIRELISSQRDIGAQSFGRRKEEVDKE